MEAIPPFFSSLYHKFAKISRGLIHGGRTYEPKLALGQRFPFALF